MELKISQEKENALFNRKEISGVIESEVAPSRIETLKALSEKFNVPVENIKIKEINGRFGSHIFNLEANIYSSKEDREKTELKKKKDEKSYAPQPAPAAEAPAEEKPVEKPKAEGSSEEKKEEPAQTTEEAPKEEQKSESEQKQEEKSE